MARVIYKFGGTSVGDTRRLYRAARRIAAAHRAGDEVVAVLSAQAGATDALLARGREIDPDCAGREADSLLSTGEQVSVSLCALALARLGVPAVSLCGWQMGLQTDGSHGSARVLGLRGDRIERELRADIADMLDARCQGRTVEESDIRAVLEGLSRRSAAAAPIRRRSRWRPSCTPISAAFIRMSTASMTATRVCIPMP